MIVTNKLSRSIVTIIVIAICIVSISFESIQPALMMPKFGKQKSSIADNIDRKIDFGRHFKELGINGSIVIDDLNRDRVYQYNSQRNNTAFLPASTFKILNSLISLETGVMPNELALLDLGWHPQSFTRMESRSEYARGQLKISAVLVLSSTRPSRRTRSNATMDRSSKIWQSPNWGLRKILINSGSKETYALHLTSKLNFSIGSTKMIYLFLQNRSRQLKIS